MTDDTSRPGGTVVVFGSTGTAGSGVIEACLTDPRVAEVRAVTRRALERSHAKLREVRCDDFANLAAIAPAFEGVDACLFCLGTSVRNVKGEAEYREIHESYALAAAKALHAGSDAATFVYLSGAGAKRTSRMMWARVKAEAEDSLAALPLPRLACVRPAGIVPARPSVANRWLLAPLVRLVPALGIGAMDLGRAMLDVGLDRSWRGLRIMENRALKERASSA